MTRKRIKLNLRVKVLISFILIIFLFILNYINAQNLLRILIHLMQPIKLITIKPADTLMTILQIDLYLTMFFLLMLGYVWLGEYLKDVLLPNEVKAYKTLKWSYLIGCSGILFSIITTKRYILPYLFKYSEAIGMQSTISLVEVLNLFVYNAFLFFVIFQIPLIVYNLIKFNILAKELITSNRRYIYFACFVLSCLLSPPDLISTFVIVVPFLILFEVGLFFASSKDN